MTNQTPNSPKKKQAAKKSAAKKAPAKAATKKAPAKAKSAPAKAAPKKKATPKKQAKPNVPQTSAKPRVAPKKNSDLVYDSLVKNFKVDSSKNNVIYANDVKKASVREKFLSWFKR